MASSDGQGQIKIFIGGLSWETRDDTFRNYFGAFGKMSDCVVMRQSDGKSRGFGFVVYEDPAISEKVLAMTDIEIDGRKIDPKRAVPKDGSGKEGQNGPPRFRSKKVFIGGLVADTPHDEFESYFAKFGKITDCIIMSDRETRRPRGFGFVTYDTDEAVDRVMEVKEHTIHGKLVECKRAVPKEDSPPRGRGRDRSRRRDSSSSSSRRRDRSDRFDRDRRGRYDDYYDDYDYDRRRSRRDDGYDRRGRYDYYDDYGRDYGYGYSSRGYKQYEPPQPSSSSSSSSSQSSSSQAPSSSSYGDGSYQNQNQNQNQAGYNASSQPYPGYNSQAGYQAGYDRAGAPSSYPSGAPQGYNYGQAPSPVAPSQSYNYGQTPTAVAPLAASTPYSAWGQPSSAPGGRW
jgi:RNA recognition motif-containing protein